MPPEPLDLSAVEIVDDGPACRVEGADRYRVRGEVRVGLDPEGVVVDATAELAYVACSRSNAVAVVDLERLETLEMIPVGSEPIDIVIDTVTNRLFTADARSDQVSVIDARSRKVIGTVPVGVYPSGLDIDEAGRRMYCGDTMGCTVSIVDLDRLECVATVPAELGAGAIALDRERRRGFCANFVTSTVTAFDLDQNEILATTPTGEGPCAVAVDRHSGDVFVVNCLAGSVVRIDPRRGEPTDELGGLNAPVGMTMGPRSDRLYVTNRGDGTLSVLGFDGLEWARIPVGTAPGGVSVHPRDETVVLVANAGSGSLTVIDLNLDGPPGEVVRQLNHPLVGTKMPEFSLYDVAGGQELHSRQWSEKRYILNFFASW